MYSPSIEQTTYGPNPTWRITVDVDARHVADCCRIPLDELGTGVASDILRAWYSTRVEDAAEDIAQQMEL